MDSLATVQQGRLAGANLGGVHTFLGVPYAKPPVGPMRWRAPEPAERWDGVRPVNLFGPIAIQTAGACFALRETRQSEDCLSLNVWCTSLDREARRPVMLWIHGGGYLGGAGSEDAYDGASLARLGVTVVTFNYRLGAFGFLAHPDAGANFAVLDVLMVLEWIAQNIGAFGGDPENVTIFGQSAGAGAVRTLLSTRRARGLFHRAIMQSAGFEPSAIAPPWTFARTQAATERLMELVGAGTVDELRSIPTDIMRKASHAVSGVVPQPGKVHTPANLVWVPVPDELVDAAGFPGWADDVPIMFGTTENEARYFIKPSGPQLPFPRSIGVAILRLVKPNGIYSWAIVKKVATALCGAHVQQVMDILHRSGKTPYVCLDWLMTSMIWREPAHQTAERFNALHRPVYCYNFGRVSPGARTSRDLARHTAEIRYVFGNLTADGQYNEADQKVADAMQWAWTTFARTGVPRSDGNGWPAFEAGAPEYMLIKDELSPRPYAVDELMTVISSMRGFWENLGARKGG
ncbi:MAG: carboxylesterase family protein [Stellaceae bacterium]